MIPVYICDDEQMISERLKKIISDQIMILDGDMGPVRVADAPAKLLELQRQNTVPAIYFLDIDFPEQISGLALAQELRHYDPRGFIVFITAHGDLAFETFRLRLEALDYIVKGDYSAMSVRVRDCLISIQDRLRDEPSGQGNYCTLKLFDTVRHIPLGDILYFEALGYKHTLRLHLLNELLEFNSSLDHFGEQLGEGFWRCHRGFLVNREHTSERAACGTGYRGEVSLVPQGKIGIQCSSRSQMNSLRKKCVTGKKRCYNEFNIKQRSVTIMANTKRMNQILEKMGFEPDEGKMIVVSYAPENLSDRIAKLLGSIFQSFNFFALSFCKESIVLIPFSTYCADVKKEAVVKKEGILELPYSSIQSVEVSEMGLNYRIDIRLEDEVISLSAQQAELSLLRMSWMYSMEDWTFVNSWHKNNLKGTLKALQEIGALE